MLVWMVASVVATVEANRSTWFLIGLIAVAARLSWQTSAADAVALDRNGALAMQGPIEASEA
jgi:hypothetical protein